MEDFINQAGLQDELEAIEKEEKKKQREKQMEQKQDADGEGAQEIDLEPDESMHGYLMMQKMSLENQDNKDLISGLASNVISGVGAGLKLGVKLLSTVA